MIRQNNVAEEEILVEIEALREQIASTHARQGEALTSERILGLSRRLDELITRYLRWQASRKASAS